MGAWTRMANFNVADNQLSGPVPAEYANWTTLNTFDVGGNQVNDNQLSGALPAEYAAWTALRRFYVHGNQLSGPLPAEYAAWTRMANFNVADNQLFHEAGAIKVTHARDFANFFFVKVAKVSAPFSIFPAFQRRCTLVWVACCSLFRGVFLARAASLKKWLFVVFRLFSKGADV